MLAAAALLWITFRMDVETPRVAIGRGWTLGGIADARWQPLFTYPDYRSGGEFTGAFRFARAMGRDTQLALVGRTGATYVNDWRRIFEGGAELTWRDLVELHGGIRHDDRLSREGALADFRDPTGRIFVGASVYPLRKGAFSAGATIDYERAALPGASRLPSDVSATAVGRIHWRR